MLPKQRLSTFSKTAPPRSSYCQRLREQRLWQCLVPLSGFRIRTCDLGITNRGVSVLLEFARFLLYCKRFGYTLARFENLPITIESWSLAMNKR
jgi:hypothetical protein